MSLCASWIWHPQRDYRAYHRTIVARRVVRLPNTPVQSATLAVTADSWYRLCINGTWINDGPARSWPEHYSYDVLDVAPYLQPGDNLIEITACFFGCGTYHQVPVQAGLLAQLDVVFTNRKTLRVCTDASWQTAPASAWAVNTPKFSQQMEPAEYYDARRDALRFTTAAVLFPAHQAPWRDLQPREHALLSRTPRSFSRFLHAKLVEKDWCAFTFAVGRLLYPGVIEMNSSVTLPVAFITVINSPRARSLQLDTYWPFTACNGKLAVNHTVRLRKGRNYFVGCACWDGPGKDQGVRFINHQGLSFENPLGPDHDNPWAYVAFNELRHLGNDIDEHTWFPSPAYTACIKGIQEQYQRVCTSVRDASSFAYTVGHLAKPVPADCLLLDPHWQFDGRRVCGDAAQFVQHPAALMHDNTAVTTVLPSPRGDIELLYDLGTQVMGYYEFDLTAPAGTIFDITGVEYISPRGRIQHTIGCKHLLRYVCKDGHNYFRSVKRRAGRFIFITLRNLTAPVHIRLVRVIESTYPVNTIGRFNCSNDAYVRIWEIAARTLQLCMEDTFTDCPLYEQTLWIGDARNEALFAMPVFGAYDLIRRCLLLGAQSLERYPLVGAQVPSSWDMLLPAWSFLWGIGVWDYYYATGDVAFLSRVWPAVMQNVRNAVAMRDARGLFSGPFWNMFDWAAVDDRHRTVLHNSLFLVGALRAARRCATVMRDRTAARWLDARIAEFVSAINALWNPATGSYPDSIHDDGSISRHSSQHTSFLALLYDVIPPEHAAAALRNCVAPPDGMSRVATPFAIHYLYEAWEHAGRHDLILQSMLDNFTPMLRAGATTVWEAFPTSTISTPDAPIRSHCHAWSAAPVYFLNRLVLGIRPTAPGGAAFSISPYLNGLSWAEGTSASVRGPVHVRWELSGHTLRIAVSAPPRVKIAYQPNPTHDGLKVEFVAEAADHFYR